MTGKGAKLGGRSEGNDNDPTSRMCEPCREKFRTLSDIQRPCDRPGCAGGWPWSVQAQLEAFATRRPPPLRLCADDEAKLAGLSDRQLPCSVPGCSRTWLFNRRAQLCAGAPDVEPAPAPAMCGPCANVYDKIADRPVTCGIRGCKRKWTWTRDEQIQDYAAGESNEPPRRLCETCKQTFGSIANRDVRCRTSGCKNVWIWPREAQLDAAIAEKPLPKAPHRMCQRCIDLYSTLRDVERPCRRAGCKRTWTDKRGAQLARAVRGKTGDPYPHYCAECEKEMGELEEQHVPCKTEHCPGTWTWTAAQQLAAGVRPTPKMEANDPEQGAEHEADGHASAASPRRSSADAPDRTSPGTIVGATVGAEAGAIGDLTMAEATDAQDHAQDHPNGSANASGNGHAAAGNAGAGAGDRKRRRRKRRREIRPPERRCEDCLAFLTDRKTKEIPCTGCKTPIHWPPESQLQTHLGNWAEPTLCGACKRDLTEAARAAERQALRQGGHAVVSDAAESNARAALQADAQENAQQGAQRNADGSEGAPVEDRTNGSAAPETASVEPAVTDAQT